MLGRGLRRAAPRRLESSREIIVAKSMSANDLLRGLCLELAPRYQVDTVPGRGDELYVWRPLWTYLLVEVTSLPEGETRLRVRADAFAHPFQWLYGHLVASKQVTRAIAQVYNEPQSGGETLSLSSMPRTRRSLGAAGSIPLADLIAAGMPADMTAQRYVESMSALESVAPVDRLPATDMPPLSLMILDSLADDAETIYTMRNCGDMQPSGVALVGEAHLLNELRTLLADGLIEVESEHIVIDDRMVHCKPPGPPPSTDDDLKRYWYVMTHVGRATWKAGRARLDAYWDAHPLRAKA